MGLAQSGERSVRVLLPQEIQSSWCFNPAKTLASLCDPDGGLEWTPAFWFRAIVRPVHDSLNGIDWSIYQSSPPEEVRPKKFLVEGVDLGI
ncbi:hypothetical protein N7499_003962 [Penicillium canescens]|uniref:Uncharacterized protein n=1 Tax=Penicillium canescens TaxID=5083 RepID=A0AAD6NEJ1_PENCN|nr:uncharacterized protein N7446_007471 [Penicillium canescens]KAJ5991545.1 hypothetical protein N7522_011752 [Penicillium canescens]KAJ6049202.1 hypothetical protein N7444_005918 [Penicillium canescens]KAJ6052827.1 hypothetical protein N7460_003361 [Penicillium canescens]KAJ6063351.1 hypothetical protein N7446_007471 [Penicillium canescens]KAJ6089115.1 hypothetical protein N7499_003962 [Penicillium canescens]